MNLEPLPDPQGLPDPEGVEAPDAPAPGGPIEKLKLQRQQLARHRTEEFEIPGYTGFYMRARRLGVERTRQILNEPDVPQVERNAQLLIDACEQLFFRDGDGDEHVTTGFDNELAEGLGITVNHQANMGPARQVVLGVFDGNEHVLVLFATAVYAWMLTVQSSEDQEALGGSTGTPSSR